MNPKTLIMTGPKTGGLTLRLIILQPALVVKILPSMAKVVDQSRIRAGRAPSAI